MFKGFLAKWLFFGALFFLLEASIVGLSVDLLLRKDNSLAKNGSWRSTKVTLEKSVFGSQSYIDGPQSVATNKLNLSNWHGFQEIIYKKTLNPTQIDAAVTLTPDSYIYLIFNKDADSFYAYRLSANPEFPSGFVNSKTSGEFKSFEPIPVSNVDFLEENKVRLVFKRSEGIVTLFINSKEVATNPATFIYDQEIGFRGSLKPVFVDAVAVYGESEEVLFSEDFSNTEDSIEILLKVVIALIVFNGILYSLLRKNAGQKKLLIITLMNFWLLVGVFLFRLYMIQQLQTYPSFEKRLPWQRNLRSEEVDWTRIESEKVTTELMQRHEELKKEDSFKIMFIGTSQTWGAGASLEDKTFARLAETSLNQYSESKIAAIEGDGSVLGVSTSAESSEESSKECLALEQGNIEVINTGVSGSNSGALLEYYKEKWVHLNPNLVLINLSVNDFDEESFRKNIQEIIQLNKSKDIKTMLILEAVSIESGENSINLHHILVEEGKEYSLPVLDLNEYLLSKNTTGILWWDFVHMTDFGQELTAEYLTSQIKEESGCVF